MATPHRAIFVASFWMVVVCFTVLAITTVVESAATPPAPLSSGQYAEFVEWIGKTAHPLSPGHQQQKQRRQETQREPISLKSLGILNPNPKRNSLDLRPVIIIPSLIGNALEARLGNAESNYWYCVTNYDEWFRIYLDTTEMIPVLIDCWFERMSMQYDQRTHRSLNATGVQMRPFDYGGVDAVNYIDTSNTYGLWNDTIHVLVELGYEVEKNLRAAPFDWRASPVDWPNFNFPDLKLLFEQTYQWNNNQSSAAISLSMGAPYFLAFLNTFVDQAWKDKYVHSWTSFDGAFGGSSSALSSLLNPGSIFGDADSLFVQYGPQWLTTMRSWASLTFMLPFGEIYGEDTVVVRAGAKNYTMSQYVEVLLASGAEDSALIFKDVVGEGFRKQTQAPGVPVHCVFGRNVSTPFALNYADADFTKVPTFSTTDGDGTVMHEGLDRCMVWKSQQPQLSASFPVENMMHGSSVHNKECIRYFISVLFHNTTLST